MLYSQAKKSINNGDLISFDANDPYSLLVKLFAGGPPHVGLAVWVRLGGCEERLCVVESQNGHGVRVMPLDFLIRKYRKVWWHKYLGNDPFGVVDRALDKWGQEYPSKFQFLLIGLRRGIDLARQHYHCSEMIASSLSEKAAFVFDKTHVLVTPKEITELDVYQEKVILEA